jgi:hypothetical protein
VAIPPFPWLSSVPPCLGGDFSFPLLSRQGIGATADSEFLISPLFRRCSLQKTARFHVNRSQSANCLHLRRHFFDFGVGNLMPGLFPLRPDLNPYLLKALLNSGLPIKSGQSTFFQLSGTRSASKFSDFELVKPKNKKPKNKKTKNMKQFAIVGILVASVGLAARANVIQIGTGLDGSGNLIGAGASEGNYAVTYNGNPIGAIAGQDAGSPPYINNQPNGQWIEPANHAVDPSGLFTYTETFFNGSSGSVNGVFASDNAGKVLVDGVIVTQTSDWEYNDNGAYALPHTFGGTLVPGLNTIEFEVYNISGPTGLIAYGTATGVPDGGMTAGLLGGALIGLQMLRRRMFC